MEAFDLGANSGPAAPAVPEATAAPAPPAPAAATNPFDADLASPTVCPQKAAAAGLLLDIAVAHDDFAPFKEAPFNNGHTNGNLYDFLDTSPNEKAPAAGPAAEGEDDDDEDDDDDDDDDSGNEMMAESAAEKRAAAQLAESAAPPAKGSANPFGAELDLELQRQQLREFDPENEPRHDTPTPPADDVPGVIGLVSDNVAESGEESEDEWNYYRVEPTEKSQDSSVKEQQTKEEVCQDQPLKVDESEENMESQLNPNAAEFIPSPTHNMPSLEEILSQAQSSEVNSTLNHTVSSVNTTDLLMAQDKENEKCSAELSTSEKEDSASPLADLSVEESIDKGTDGALNESVAFSTKAECGDETTDSITDFEKILESSRNIMESSLMGKDLFASEEQTGSALEDSTEPGVVEQETIFQQDLINDFQKEPVHISFELQKEIAPQMEARPERVKVDSEEQSPTLDTELELQIANDLTERNKLVDNLEFIYNDVSATKIPELEDFIAVSNPATQDVESDRTVDFMATKFEETMTISDSPRIDEVDLLREVNPKSFPGADVLELSQSVVKSHQEETAIPPTMLIENDFQHIEREVRQPSPPSESPLSELTDDLLIQQESHSQLSNEISTPEYEKLEKVLEASEQFQNQFNIAKNEIPVDFSSHDQSNLGLASDVLLESAHPDTVALLDDACAEPVRVEDTLVESTAMDDFAQLGNGPLNVSFPATALPGFSSFKIAPQSAAFESPFVDSFTQPEATPLTESVPEIDVPPAASLKPAHVDIVAQPGSALNDSLEVFSQGSVFEPQSFALATEGSALAHIPSHGDMLLVESVQNEFIEATQAPPPTPLITQLTEEPLNFSQGTENITEVAEKLSATQQRSEVNGLGMEDIVSESFDVQPVNQLIVEDFSITATQSTDVTKPETLQAVSEETPNVKSNDDGSLKEDLVLAAVAAGGVAAAVATAAVTSSADKEAKKKEKDVPTAKKSVMLSGKDKKPSTEKPKTATKTTISSRLTATTKPKSPTSPVKAPVAQKTASRPLPSTVANKPSPKPPITKTATRPVSSTLSRTNASLAASKPKAAGSQVPVKPSPPIASLTKTRPASSPIEKKTITNGDIKTAPKRPEQLPTKTSTTRVTQRPATAPPARAVSKTTSTVSPTVTKAKAPLNGPSKPRLSSVTQVRTATKVSNEKEIKDTANKQISTRTTTSTVRSTTTTMASKTSVTSASRRIESKVLTNGKGPATKPSSMVKTTSTTTTTASSRISPKKPAAATRVKTTKTESIVEKSETVQGSKTVIAVNE